MLSSFTNIDDGITQTRWKSYAHGVMFNDASITSKRTVIDSDDEYHVGYTSIVSEMPLILSGDSVAYWDAAPVNQTKLATYNMFITKYDAIPETLTVYLNGKIISDYTLSDNCEITIPQSNTDGYLFVSYIPMDPLYSAGNKVTSLDSAYVRSKYRTPIIDKDEIERCRKAINNLEYHVEFGITQWIGGPGNSEKSYPENIIPGKTEISLEHIYEMRSALLRIQSKLNSNLISDDVINVSFSDVADDSYFRVEYLEEIRHAINTMETTFMSLI